MGKSGIISIDKNPFIGSISRDDQQRKKNFARKKFRNKTFIILIYNLQ